MAFMAVALPYIMAATAVVGAVSAIQQGKAAKAADDFNANIASQNAQIARADAAAQAVQADREQYMRFGAIRAAQGKAGGAAGAGSVLDVLADNAMQGELERQNIIYQGEQRARGYSNTASLDTFAGKNAQTSGYMKAGTELLSGGTKAYTANAALKRA